MADRRHIDVIMWWWRQMLRQHLWVHHMGMACTRLLPGQPIGPISNSKETGIARIPHDNLILAGKMEGKRSNTMDSPGHLHLTRLVFYKIGEQEKQGQRIAIKGSYTWTSWMDFHGLPFNHGFYWVCCPPLRDE
ncbi:unnamed protein product [Pieris macdunnoughi]|uniref:Uncharacterized protein n=1 Tax=Pieris macdunnoughi TaxID=345717 RepID=A0A821RT30_9NEOP|nr:unnamed protein product [Pieris macdunnoughi]